MTSRESLDNKTSSDPTRKRSYLDLDRIVDVEPHDPEMFLSGSTQAYGKNQLSPKSIILLEKLILANKGKPIALSCGEFTIISLGTHAHTHTYIHTYIHMFNYFLVSMHDYLLS